MGTLRCTADGFGRKLVIALTALLGVAAIRAYVGAFYAGQQIDAMLVFPGEDAPRYRTQGYEAIPVWGHHYFGDLQEGFAWGTVLLSGVSPYEFLANYPPASFFVFLPLLWLSTKTAVILVIAVSLVALIAIAWRLTSGVTLELRAQVLLVCVIVTTPMLAMLDRGNSALQAAILVGFALLAFRNARYGLASVLVGAAAAIKIVPIVLVVSLVAGRKWLMVLISLGTVVITTLLAAAVLPGGILASLQGFLAGATAFSQERLIHKDYSSTGMILQLATLVVPGIVSALGAYSLWITVGTSLAWIAVLYYIIRRRAVTGWVVGVLALASMQMVAPQAYAYGTWWAIFGALWIVGPSNFRDFVDVSSPPISQFVGNIAVIAVALTLSPLALEISIEGIPFGIQSLFSPLLLWVLLLYVAIRSPRKEETPVM